MHTSSLLLASITAAASSAAAAAPVPPQITSPPSARDLKLKLMARGRFENPYKPPDKDYSSYDLNPIELECMLTTLPSITDSDIPSVTDERLWSWLISEVAATRTVTRTITDIAEVDGLCVTTDDVQNMPASLTSAWTAWTESVMEWKKGFHSEAYSIAEKCGTRFGPVFSQLVATDYAECQAAISAAFGTGIAYPGVEATATSSTAAARSTGDTFSEGSGSGSGPIETATSAGAEETNAAQTGRPGSGTQGSGTGSLLANGGLVTMMAALAGVASLFAGL